MGGGRDGWREGWVEGGMEGGMEGGKEGGMEGGVEGGRGERAREREREIQILKHNFCSFWGIPVHHHSEIQGMLEIFLRKNQLKTVLGYLEAVLTEIYCLFYF